MPRPTLVLVSNLDGDRIFSAEVAKTLGTDFIQVPPEKILETLDHLDEAGLVFFGVSESGSGELFNKALLPRVGAHGNTAHTTIHPELVHIMGSLDTIELSGIRAKSTFGSFIIRAAEDPGLAGSRYGNIIAPMVSRRLGVPAAAPASIPADLFRMELGHSNDKERALSALDAFLRNDDMFSSPIRNTILTAVDELLMNAIYDAPKNGKGDQILRGTPRSVAVALPSTHIVEMKAVDLGNAVSVTVTDRYGTAKRADVLRHILQAHRTSFGQVDPAAFGMGIGLTMTVRSGGSLFFAVSPGQRTEVTVTYLKTKSAKDFRSQFRFVAVQLVQGNIDASQAAKAS